MYALVDVNSFYTSCETVWRPDLTGKPVVVLSNNDGCVISRSAEAKALGINMAEPFFKQKELMQRHGVAVFSSNYALYGDMSHRVMTLLEEICPGVDMYSIDEAFVDLTGIPHLRAFGKTIRDAIYQRTMLTVGVGIAPTKTLAKLANHAAKKWPEQSRGVVDLSRQVNQHKLMAALPVGDVWGIGRRLSKRLDAMGIDTVLKLAQSDLWFIRKNFSVVLERTVRELRGEPCLGFSEFSPSRNEIISSRSFGQRVSDYASVREGICTWAARAAEKLRAEHQYCRYVGAFIKSSPHDDDEPYYSNRAGIRLLTPTHDTRDIIAAATRSLDIIWKQGPRYQKAGVMLGDFFSKGVAQLNLFDEYAPQGNSEALMHVLDRLNKKGNKLWFAGQGVTPDWTMKRSLLSPAWTTQLDDVPQAG
ncbi:translesion error-prone DNA polymerase V subunit UmuC [Kosakonia sp. BYX6]|uniref:Translesion error-prone DNA polymerase V subunit UmuC n=1 Tax=Kosakonia calanthes TaxID=3139408 RepID=A0ABZ3AZQ3_9ENTR